ncbi:MAG: T9SS type A sorting domain-containing protein [Flavobacteriales bacterium]|nr:T9SS type A sorting domain-containing protein [Flavobacteriales bacterium]
MKKLFFTFFSVGIVGWAMGQKATVNPAPYANVLHQKVLDLNTNRPKTLVCSDTLRYPQMKEQVIGSPANPQFYTFELWTVDAEFMSQTFLLSGASMNVSGVEFFGRRSPSSTPNLQVRASIFNVDANNNPTTSIGFADITITDTLFGYRQVNFASALSVSNNYAVVIHPISSGGIVQFYVNNAVPNQPQDENLSRIRSSFYASSNGNWVSVPTLTAGFTGGPYDFEMLVAPKVSYTINTSFTATPNPVCFGTPVNFTNTSTPNSILSSRMYNFNRMRTHFQSIPDSTYVYNMGGAAPLIWNANTTYTFPTVTTHNPALFTLGGLWANCLDNATQAITVNALPTVSAGAVNPTFCSGGSTTLNASGASTYTWSPSTGLSATTGNSVTASPTSPTTYTVTGTLAGCSNTAQVTLNILPLDNANFVYSSNTICDGGPNITPTTNVAGIFSSTPGGLIFANSVTGEINVAASSPGIYSVTYSTNGTCPNSSTQTLNITNAPDAGFSYPNAAYCANGTNPGPVFGSGASAGTFSSTGGLSINPGTGIINLAASIPGNYVVTNTIAASGVCPAASSTTNITIHDVPMAEISGGGAICDDGISTSNLTIALSGSGPWNFTFTDGTDNFDVNNYAQNTFGVSVGNAGTYTVVNVTDAFCSNTGTGIATVVVNPLPTVTLEAFDAVCSNASAITLSGGLPAGGTYSGTGVSGGVFTPANAPLGSDIIYTYTDINNCSSSATQSIDVNAAPSVSFTLSADTLCVYSAELALSGATPAGGTFSGTGVTGNTFNPATAGTGSFVIEYIYTDNNNCVGIASETIAVSACAGINENNPVENLILAPNPVTDRLHISFTPATPGKVMMKILSANGKLVHTEQFVNTLQVNTSVDVASFAKGVYFVQFMTDKGQVTHKILVQ